MGGAEIAVVGQIARDLVLVVDEVPGPSGTTGVRTRREMLGGKGTNQAVALAQLGARPRLIGVVGADRTGEDLLAQARRDRIDVTGVVRRDGTETALIVDVVVTGRWRYLEHVPDATLLTEADIDAAAPLLRTARAVSIQMQQPSATTLPAARHARHAGAMVVLDGAPVDDAHRDPLLATADLLRADARETALLTGERLREPSEALRAARTLLRRGPSLVALSLEEAGDLFAWDGGHLFVPYPDTPVVDTTGAGDAFTAALTDARVRGEPPEHAARLAVAAASATVDHPGGRPDLTPESLRSHLPPPARAR